MTQESFRQEPPSVMPWDPKRSVRSFDPAEARFSRGFLRSRPERWFPAFAAQWLPLAHSLGAELRLIEVKPLLLAPRGLDHGFAGTVDDEPIGIFLDADSMRVIIDAVSPGGTPAAQSVVLEYLARRFLSSLAVAWSGAESSVVQFQSEVDPFEIPQHGAVKLTVMVNNNYCTVWVGLGRRLIERLDGLWRRQLHSNVRKGDSGGSLLRMEVAQLAVPPSTLTDYTKPGTVIDLETLVSDSITLRVDGKPWMPSRICDVGGKLGFEILPGPVSVPTLPEGTTRLSIEFAEIPFDANSLAELGQVGAVWQTAIDLGNQIVLTINGEPIARGTLCVYEGRFAISVE